jgi:arginine-tRNA-protein transferase
MEDNPDILERFATTSYDWGPCPYGKPGTQVVNAFACERLDGALYERALARGWRRSGMIFYRTRCPDCAACVPLRVDAGRIEPTKSQRRVSRLNADLSVSAGIQEFTEEDYALFSRYLFARHGVGREGFTREDYRRSYIESPVESAIARYRKGDGSLVALSFLDVLPDGLSSVYFAFEPEEGRRSLGVHSVFADSALARELGKRWYYLGFRVEGCKKMEYKARFAPHEIAASGVWRAV